MILSAGSVLNAGYVGVGATPSGLPPGTTNPTQVPGGTGNLILRDGTVNTTTLEIGADGTLSGSGVVNALGDVIVGGTISPGESPGRLRINCNLISLEGSKLIWRSRVIVLVASDYDQLIIGQDSTFDLKQFEIVFSFLGETNPLDFANSSSDPFDLDNFLRAGLFVNGLPVDQDVALSEFFADDTTWNDVVDSAKFSAVSDLFTIDLRNAFKEDGTFNSELITVAAIPEPSTWALILLALLILAVRAQSRRRVFRAR